MAALVLAVVALALNGAHACFLPPHGCLKNVCDYYKDMIIPPSSGNFNNLDPGSAWNDKELKKLAFIRTSFNKNIGTTGPNKFTAAEWLALLNGYGKITSGPPSVPALQWENFSLKGSKYSDAPAAVTYGSERYTPSSGIAACCHACRVSEGCPMYAFIPEGVAGKKPTKGRCVFITEGANEKDGPFDFTVGTDGKSARVVNLKSPKAMDKGVANDTTYFGMFVGGYCNPWKYTNGTITDDPHFLGAHGTRFDFNGELNKAFCLVTDKSISVNAVLKGYKSDNTFGATENAQGKAVRSWIKELGLVWRSADNSEHTLRLVARSGKQQERGDGFIARAELDGEAFAVPQETGFSTSSGDFSMTYVSLTKKGKFDMDQFRVVIGDTLDLSFNMRVAHPLLQTETDAEAHFNLLINNIKVTESVHGVLGQTYRNTGTQVMKAVKYQELTRLMGGPVKADGESGAGFLEGVVTDYETSDVLRSDCKVSSYAA